MKRWIAVALWLCLFLVMCAYGGVAWYLRGEYSSVVTERTHSRVVPTAVSHDHAYPAIIDDAPSSASLAAERLGSSRNRFQSSRLFDEPKPSASIGTVQPSGQVAANLSAGSQAPQVPRWNSFDDSMPELPLHITDAPAVPTQFVVENAAPESRFDNHPPAPFENAAPRDIQVIEASDFGYRAGDEQNVRTASHQLVNPPSSSGSRPPTPNPIRGHAASAAHALPGPPDVTNPMKGMKVAVLLSSQPHELQATVEQRSLGGKAVRILSPSIVVPRMEIKVYAQSFRLIGDEQLAKAPRIEAPHELESGEEGQAVVVDPSADYVEPVGSLASVDEAESVDVNEHIELTPTQPVGQPQGDGDPDESIAFQFVCEGPVVVVTPNGLIRGEGLRYERGGFKVGSALIENPDTVITAGEITFPFEIGNVQILRLGIGPTKKQDRFSTQADSSPRFGGFSTEWAPVDSAF